jgi:tRNA A37 N6-isopentenylltransferase MiaA
MSANKFSRDARRLILDIQSRGKIPIMDGGSTFYINHLFEANLDTEDLIPEEVL